MSSPRVQQRRVLPTFVRRLRLRNSRQRWSPQFDRLEERALLATFSNQSFAAPAILELGVSNGPPAPSVAVSPTRVLGAVNGQLQISDQSGNGTQTVSFANFFSSVGHGGIAFEPSVLYDPYAQRFWVVMPEIDAHDATQSFLDIAVSTASGPTLGSADWHIRSIPASTVVNGTRYAADFPRAAADATNLYISVNYAGPPGPIAGVFRLDKSLMVNDQPLPANLQPVLPGDNSFSLAPAQSAGSPPSAAQYFVDSSPINGGVVRVWAWPPTAPAPTRQATLTVGR